MCAVLTAACSAKGGGNDGSGKATGRSTTTTKEALEAYCASALGYATVEPPKLDVAAPEAEQAVQRQQYATSTLKPAVDDLAEDAPAEIESDANVVVAAVEELAATGAPETYDNDTVDLARGRLHEFDLEHCDLASEPVTMTDFAFSSLDSVKAGVVSFDATNDGQEYHELAIVMKRPGTTETFDQILALNDAAAQERLATYVGGVEPVGPGEDGFTVVNLRAGDYLIACFLPVGSAPEPFEAGAAINGPPHTDRGMKAELTVE